MRHDLTRSYVHTNEDIQGEPPTMWSRAKIPDELPEGMVGLRRLDIEWLEGKLSGRVYGIVRDYQAFSQEAAARELVRQALEHTQCCDTSVEVKWWRCVINWDAENSRAEIPEIDATFSSLTPEETK